MANANPEKVGLLLDVIPTYFHINNISNFIIIKKEEEDVWFR